MNSSGRTLLSDDFDLILIGLRGSGKSTLTGELARTLSAEHNITPEVIDLDDLTPQALGAATVADALRTHGEPAFRRAEVITLRKLLDKRPPTPTNVTRDRKAGAWVLPARIIALGGGTPTAIDGSSTAADTLRAARNSGRALIVYLHLNPAELRERLSTTDNAHRPALTPAGTLDEIPVLYAARDRLYRELASFMVESMTSPAPATARVILSQLKHPRAADHTDQ
jgi:shikimate kinase